MARDKYTTKYITAIKACKTKEEIGIIINRIYEDGYKRKTLTKDQADSLFKRGGTPLIKSEEEEKKELMQELRMESMG